MDGGPAEQIVPLAVVLVPDGELQILAGHVVQDLDLVIPGGRERVLYERRLQPRVRAPPDLTGAVGIRQALAGDPGCIRIAQAGGSNHGDLQRSAFRRGCSGPSGVRGAPRDVPARPVVGFHQPLQLAHGADRFQREEETHAGEPESSRREEGVLVVQVDDQLLDGHGGPGLDADAPGVALDGRLQRGEAHGQAGRARATE
mmetsp:Transcript_18548/g.42049  ORF Transcript_18548/g.42049 Transcript_18548/m.42049 type:complete len:201 (+) Transcript_18548:473-1075(+)